MTAKKKLPMWTRGTKILKHVKYTYADLLTIAQNIGVPDARKSRTVTTITNAIAKHKREMELPIKCPQCGTYLYRRDLMIYCENEDFVPDDILEYWITMHTGNVR